MFNIQEHYEKLFKTSGTISYKGRGIEIGEPVQAYRCLPRKGKVYSLRQNGLVVAHTTSVILRSCYFRIQQSGRNRALETGRRNVHAYIEACGIVNSSQVDFPVKIVYTIADGFRTTNGDKVVYAKVVLLDENGCSARGMLTEDGRLVE